MTTSDINGIIIGALITLFGIFLLSIFWYFVFELSGVQQWEKEYPKIQILTIDELLDGAEVKMPPTRPAFRLVADVNYQSGFGKVDWK